MHSPSGSVRNFPQFLATSASKGVHTQFLLHARPCHAPRHSPWMKMLQREHLHCPARTATNRHQPSPTPPTTSTSSTSNNSNRNSTATATATATATTTTTTPSQGTSPRHPRRRCRHLAARRLASMR